MPPEEIPLPQPPFDQDYSPGTGGPSASDIAAMLEYIKNFTFGNDGDYTGNGGYGGDNIGPPGSKEPEKDVDHSRNLLDGLLAPPSKLPGAFPRRVHAIDVYSGLRPDIESPDPFTGLLPSDPFTDSEQGARFWSAAPFAIIRQKSLLSSPYLLAENDVIACDPTRATCLPKTPKMMSDFNQSSMLNLFQAELDREFVAMLPIIEKKEKIVGTPEVDMHKIASKAVEMTRSDEYKLAFAANQLRHHPLEIRHSALWAGLGHMASGAALAGGSVAVIYGTGGVALPLGGAMGLATGTAQFFSGLTLAVSGADSTETLRMSGQLDYVFALTASPAKLVFGTTGLVLSGGDVDVSHRFALTGGVFEDLMTFRGDPSKLYSAVVPGVGTKAEKATSVLLVKDVTALGFTARAENIEQVAAKLNRNFTVDDLQAIGAFRVELAASHRLDFAGGAGHVAAGAAGSGGGVDFSKYGGAFQQELKLHGPNTLISGYYLDKASTQSLNYSIKYQLETRAFGEQLVPLRSVKHIWISPTEAVRYVGH